MIVTTWNLNGLRAALGKGLLDSLRLISPDVLCLQEVRARPEQIDGAALGELEALFPYHTWNPAQRGGYSGVAVLGKVPAQEIRLGLGEPRFDGEGRVIAWRMADFWLFDIYFPHGGHDHSRVPFKLDFYARLLHLCDGLLAGGEPVMLCGDFNTAHQEIDLRNPKQNKETSGFLPEERAWVDRYLQHGFVDIYRHLYPGRVQYTWWTYRMNARARNVGWRLDYFLVSPGLVGRVQDAIIHEDVTGSDHCPVSLVLADE